jgi:hypothetical protein
MLRGTNKEYTTELGTYIIGMWISLFQVQESRLFLPLELTGIVLVVVVSRR